MGFSLVFQFIRKFFISPYFLLFLVPTLPLIFFREAAETEDFFRKFDACVWTSEIVAFFVLLLIRLEESVDNAQILLSCTWGVLMGMTFFGVALPRKIKITQASYLSVLVVILMLLEAGLSNALLSGSIIYLALGVMLRREDQLTAFEFAGIAFISHFLLLPAVWQRGGVGWISLWAVLVLSSLFAVWLTRREQ